MTAPVQKFNKLIENIPGVNTINYLHSVFGKKGVRVSYEKSKNFDEKNPEYNRFMLGTFKRSCPFWFPGIIIGKVNKGYKVISVPPAPPVSQYQTRVLFKHYPNDVKATCADDGTTITLYYYDGRWVASTHRGYEVNSFVRDQKKTYDDILKDVFAKYKFSYDSLDKNRCYTFGFKHIDYHPFLETELDNSDEKLNVRAWFIQSVDLTKFNNNEVSVSYDDKIGFPLQKTQTFKDLRTLFKESNGAYDDFKKNKSINYGYLIRVGFKHFLVESSLLKNIRHIFYSNKFAKLDAAINKTQYIIIYAFLDGSLHTKFKTMFSQYEPEFKKLNIAMDNIVSYICNSVIDNTPPTTDIELVSLEIRKQMDCMITLKKLSSKELQTAVYSYIYHNRFTDMLYGLNLI
jgi:hypothetical protein